VNFEVADGTLGFAPGGVCVPSTGSSRDDLKSFFEGKNEFLKKKKKAKKKM